jgi:hypothetical protein
VKDAQQVIQLVGGVVIEEGLCSPQSGCLKIGRPVNAVCYAPCGGDG